MRAKFVPLALALGASALVAASSRPAQACGGLFCDNIQPVVQTAERILFVIDDGRTDVYVEVQYEGPPSQFAWVIPVPADMEIDDVGVAPAGIFDELERLTAPVFEYVEPVGEGDESGALEYSDEGGGCGFGSLEDSAPLPHAGDDPWEPPPPDTSGVDVVGDAVVGPYAIELIEAEHGDTFANWLALNGYQMPQSAIEPLDHYIDRGMNFVGVKLEADVPAGPIDTLSFSYEGNVAAIPLRLTAIAAADDMEILAYVGAMGRYGPDPESMNLPFDYGRVSWLDGETDYDELLRADMEARPDMAFHTEHALPRESMPPLTGLEVEPILDPAAYVTRFHGFVDAVEMTADPRFMPSASLPDVDHEHTIYGDEVGGDPRRDGGGWGIFAPFVVFAFRRRPR